MPRTARAAPPGYVYHVLNRAVARLPLLQNDGDYAAFERVLVQALIVQPVRVLGYCLMPNHWHLVLWPERPRQLTAFTRWLTHTHTMRWHTHYDTMGTGHLYQGRFKSFPVAEDDHFYRLLRYVERNALRAKLVARAEDWRWSSLWRRQHPEGQPALALADWPVRMPEDWLDYVNGAETEAELQALRTSVCRGTPFGSASWQEETALGCESSVRCGRVGVRGRPKNELRPSCVPFLAPPVSSKTLRPSSDMPFFVGIE
jgi:putative transposase